MNPYEYVMRRTIVDIGCWAYSGGHSDGYAICGRTGLGTRKVHRLMYQWFIGEPNHQTLDHLCRNRWCVNPYHLEDVPGRINTLRGEGITAQNARKEKCHRGHEFTTGNTYVFRGSRFCRRCNGIRNLAWRTRKLGV